MRQPHRQLRRQTVCSIVVSPTYAARSEAASAALLRRLVTFYPFMFVPLLLNPFELLSASLPSYRRIPRLGSLVSPCAVLLGPS